MPRKPPTEQQIQHAILDYLNACPGVFAWKSHNGAVWDPRGGFFRRNNSKYMPNGIPDILGVIAGGRMLAIEVKRPTNYNITDEQRAMIDNLTRMGALAFIAHSVEEVASKLVLKNPNESLEV